MKRTEFEKIITENGLMFSYVGGAGDFVTVKNHLKQKVAIISETSAAHPYWLDLTMGGKPNIPGPAYQAINDYAATEPKDRETRWLNFKVDADDIETVYKGWINSGIMSENRSYIEFENPQSKNIVEKIVNDLHVQTLEDDEHD